MRGHVLEPGNGGNEGVRKNRRHRPAGSLKKRNADEGGTGGTDTRPHCRNRPHRQGERGAVTISIEAIVPYWKVTDSRLWATNHRLFYHSLLLTIKKDRPRTGPPVGCCSLTAEISPGDTIGSRMVHLDAWLIGSGIALYLCMLAVVQLSLEEGKGQLVIGHLRMDIG